MESSPRRVTHNSTNLTDLANGVIFGLFYVIQESQDAPKKKEMIRSRERK